MRYSLRHILTIGIAICLLAGCQEYRVSTDPTLRLAFSTDTLSFDTVFTGIGSATRRVMVYNPNKNALNIKQIWLENGAYFHINMDGETNSDYMRDLPIAGGDSLYLFVRVNVDPQNSHSPVFIEDKVHFSVNEHTQDICLTAYGQDVELMRTPGKRTDFASGYHFTATRPYLIYDTLVIAGQTTMDPGAKLYFHQNASMYVLGTLKAQGTIDQRICLRGDRTDNLFDSVPYLYAAGQWGGVVLQSSGAHTHVLNYVEILGGNYGLYCDYDNSSYKMPSVNIENSRIHNQAVYGLVVQNMNAKVVNTEISNAASYCVYLSGGKHTFVHTTIASYFNNTNVRIQSTPHEDVAAIYVNNLSKSTPETEFSLINCVVSGTRRNNIVLATPLPQYYPGKIVGNYLKSDSIFTLGARDNVYWQETDSANVFQNDFYKYKTWRYYDFRLDSLSPARAIADSVQSILYPTDRDGNTRNEHHPDAGCYEYVNQ